MTNQTTDTTSQASEHQANTQDDSAQQAIEIRRERLKLDSTRIIDIADNEANSALKCIHQLSVAGGATEATYLAIERRVVADQDAAGAYHLALLAQSTPDLPIDVRQLIEMVVDKGDNQQRLALLKNLPFPPVDIIKAQILLSDDGDAIGQMNAYLQINPEGYGSQHMVASQPDSVASMGTGMSNGFDDTDNSNDF